MQISFNSGFDEDSAVKMLGTRFRIFEYNTTAIGCANLHDVFWGNESRESFKSVAGECIDLQQWKLKDHACQRQNEPIKEETRSFPGSCSGRECTLFHKDYDEVV